MKYRLQRIALAIGAILMLAILNISPSYGQSINLETNTPTMTPTLTSTAIPTWTPTVTPTSTPTEPPPPIPSPMPTYSIGTTNTFRWNNTPGDGALYFEAQCCTSPGCPLPTPSGWLTRKYYTFTNLGHGTKYYYRARAKNIYNGISDWSELVSSTQDAFPPATQVSSLPPITYSPDFNIPFVVQQEDVSGFKHVALWYKKDGYHEEYVQYDGFFNTSPISFSTTLGNGMYRFYTIGYDNVGNEESPPPFEDAYTTIDTNTFTPTPTASWTATDTPTITQTPTRTPSATPSFTPTHTKDAPTPPRIYKEPAYTAGDSNLVKWTDEFESGAIEYYAEMSVDNFQSVSSDSGWIPGTEYTFQHLNHGIKYFYRVKDRNAKLYESDWSNVEWSIQDQSLPESFIDQPQQGQFIGGNKYTIRGTAVDDVSNIKYVELTFDNGNNWVTASGGEEWAYEWQLPKSGQYTIRSRAHDDVDNVEDPVKPGVVVVIDREPPLLAIGGYMDTRLASTGGGVLTLAVFCTDVNITPLELYYNDMPTGIELSDNGPPGDWTAGDDLWMLIVPITGSLPPSNLLLEVYTEDYAGNIAWWPALYVTE